MYQKFETIDELANRWKIKKSWLYAKTMNTGEGSIPRVKVGKYLRFVPEEADEWLKKQNENE
jgi:predicted DNA-binding transcriptional regulator AlpA